MFWVVTVARESGRSLTSVGHEPETPNVLEDLRQFDTMKIALPKMPIAATPETFGVRLEVSK